MTQRDCVLQYLSDNYSLISIILFKIFDNPFALQDSSVDFPFSHNVISVLIVL